MKDVDRALAARVVAWLKSLPPATALADRQKIVAQIANVIPAFSKAEIDGKISEPDWLETLQKLLGENHV